MSTPEAPPPARRLAAVGALVVYAAAAAALVFVLVDNLLALLGAWVSLLLFAAAAWVVVTRRGPRRVVAAVVGVVALAGGIALLLRAGAVLEVVAVPALLVAGTFAARYALERDPRALRDTVPPGVRMPAGHHPVLLMNPKSGGGKVEQFHLEAEARARGIEPVVLGPGDDLETLARAAVARGADVLGMAGGDGSQAIVAGIAAELDLPFVCVPAGTRNHLALDLGVDRDDVVGALEAYVDGYERRVDLATVDGRVFVNNVSLGIYAKVVQSDAYRDAKLGTAANLLPELLGPDSEPFDLRFDGPGGTEHDHADLVLVSNNRYRLDRIGGFGTRARLDEGVLGIVAVAVRSAADAASLVALETAGQISRFGGWREWVAPTFEVRSSEPIELGVDGEAQVASSPLRFEIRPAALRVRVAPHHPGRSPAAAVPTFGGAALGHLVGVALGRARGAPDAADLGRSR
jgi:diacylglycerol kinase family enzyme